MRQPWRWLVVPAIVFVVFGIAFVGSGRGSAQDATEVVEEVVEETTQAAAPTSGPAEAGSGLLPVALHQGTCQDPVPEPAFDAGDLQPRTPGEGQTAVPEDIRGTLTGPPVLASSAEIETNLDALLDPASPYVIIVHQSAEAFSSYLACGEVGGPAYDEDVIIALRTLNNSGYAGIGIVSGGEGDTTNVTTYLFGQAGALSGQQAQTPSPPPAPAAGSPIPPTPTPTPAPLTPSPTPTVVPSAPSPTPTAPPVTPSPTGSPTPTAAAPTPTPVPPTQPPAETQIAVTTTPEQTAITVTQTPTPTA
jgi:hypothetical protein